MLVSPRSTTSLACRDSLEPEPGPVQPGHLRNFCIEPAPAPKPGSFVTTYGLATVPLKPPQ